MHPPPLLPPWAGAILVAGAAALCVWGVARLRRARLEAAWADVARWMGGAVEPSDAAPGLRAKGRVRGYAAFLGEGISHEDAIPYPHTRGALNVRNPASVVMGLRRKSMLEEVVTRKDSRPVETGDGDFDRAFFLLLTTPEHAQALLPANVRRALLRHPDVEVYLKSTQIAWRKAGTVRSARDMQALFECIADIADALDALPTRDLPLSQKLADEALIEKGV